MLRVRRRYSHPKFSSSSPIQVAKSGLNQQPAHSFSTLCCSGYISKYSDGVTVCTLSSSDSRRYISWRNSLPSFS